jgi:hypothetical protein
MRMRTQPPFVRHAATKKSACTSLLHNWFAQLPKNTVARVANGEIGQDVLKCMANTTDSLPRCYNAKQPVGLYFSALTPADMTPSFSKLASEILRIAK